MKQASIHLIQLATSNINSYGRFSIASVLSYCKKYGYKYSVLREKIVDDLHINWTKIQFIKDTLEKSGHDYVVLLDADVVLVNQKKDIHDFIAMGNVRTRIWMPEDTPILKPKRPNAGLIIVKNDEEGRAIISRWMDAARNEGSHLADTHPRNQLVYWNYVMPSILQQQHMIPRSFAAKYHWFLPQGSMTKLFLLHVTQSRPGAREKIMQKLYEKYIGDQLLLDRVNEFLEAHPSGIIDFQETGELPKNSAS